MRTTLMFADRVFEPVEDGTSGSEDLVADLGLETLITAMTRGDRVFDQVVRTALFDPLTEPDTIRHRQDVLEDCIAHPDVVSRLFAIAGRALEVERHLLFGWSSARPSSRLHFARERLVGYAALLRELRSEADTHGADFTSAGFRSLFEQFRNELDDAYLDEVELFLKILAFRPGVDVSAALGRANEGVTYRLHPPRRTHSALREFITPDWSRHTVTVDPRDIAGSEELAGMSDSGLAVAAEATAQGADHVRAFFLALRNELAFYIGCLNLREQLVEAHLPLCRPEAGARSGHGIRAQGLCEPLLALRGEHHVVGNDVDADGSRLVVITGANQGGKSTFLRSLGIAQVMMQAGMFVAAESFTATPADLILTHFKREEDEELVSGKFDEELVRMSAIVDRVTSRSLLLCNESFSSTNENEAAAVGSGILTGLLDCGVEVRLVTHLYEFAHRLGDEVADVTFLRADRGENGTRTFRIEPGAPLRTSYAADLYERVFGHELEPAR